MSTNGMEEKKRREEIWAEEERSGLTISVKTSATKKQNSQGDGVWDYWREKDQRDGRMPEGWKRREEMQQKNEFDGGGQGERVERD